MIKTDVSACVTKMILCQERAVGEVTALDEQHASSGLAQDRRRHLAAGAGADHDRVVPGQKLITADHRTPVERGTSTLGQPPAGSGLQPSIDHAFGSA